MKSFIDPQVEIGFWNLALRYFAEPSYRRKGPKKFLRDRSTRLLIPLAFYEIVIAPSLCFLARPFDSLDFPPGLSDAPSVLVWYLKTYKGVGRNPMWFVAALFLFDAALVLSNRAFVAGEKSSAVVLAAAAAAGTAGPFPSTSAVGSVAIAPFPTNFAVGAVATIGAALAGAAFVIRILFPVGFWLPAVFPGFQLAYFGQYILAFTLGVFSYRSNAVRRLSSKIGYGCLGLALAWFGIGYSFLVALFEKAGDSQQEVLASILGGANFLQAFFSFFEQGFAVLWSVGLLVAFREWVNYSPEKLGKLGPAAGAVVGAAYTVYIIHPVFVMGLACMLFLVWSVHPLVQIVVEIPLVIISTWLVAAAMKRLPYAGTIL